MAQKLLRISDHWRAFLVSASVVVLLAGALGLAVNGERQNRIQATETAEVQARVLAETVTAAVSFGDRDALQEYVNALRLNSQVEAVGVFDLHGNLMAAYSRSSIAHHLSEVQTPFRAPDKVIVFVPIEEAGTKLGTVYLLDRSEPLIRRLTRYIAPGLLVAMAALMFTVIGLDSAALRRTNRALETQIAEREKAETALHQSQKMEAIGRLTGGIAHDFNNMLAIVIGSLDLMLSRRDADTDRNMRLAEQAMAGARRAAELTQRLLAFSRQQPLRPVSADIAKSVEGTGALLRRILGDAISIETVAAGGLWRAQIDVSQLEIALVNLAINARDAMPDGGRLTIETSNAYLDRAYTSRTGEVEPGEYVVVAVTDTGTGIAAEILDQVFEPFFTTKPVGRGTGLGLSQVHGFVRQSGGHVQLSSEVGVGTTVKLYLPRAYGEGETTDPGARPSSPTGRRGVTVLVVEDEAGVRQFAVDALEELGFDALAADSAKAGLKLLEVHPEIGLLLTDVQMPEMNGRAFAEAALARRASLPVLFMTGYARDAIVHNSVLDADAKLIAKPFTLSELRAELESMLSAKS